MLAAALATMIGAASVDGDPAAAQTVSIAELSQRTHIHGLAVDPGDATRLLVATHHGLFRTGPDGSAERISPVQDFMGFTPHPVDAAILYASGHPVDGGNLGFIASDDGGRSWTQISAGLDGPVDFHQMTVSRADPRTIYGAYGQLQVSRDAGRNWMAAGRPPARLIDLAASAVDADTVYAATETGLYVSTDGGSSWHPLLRDGPVSLVEVTADGTLHAFVVGRGLVRASEPPIRFDTVSADFGSGYLLHLAADPARPERLFAVNEEGRIVASVDDGRSWRPFTGSLDTGAGQ
ncbi:MAG: hypothetical protein BroJett030_17870 [Alphaproteobacteria bacterium]|nr:MAG: hypothetical protein BroJett030_17870 [Alphaproteobacteria bacterium]